MYRHENQFPLVRHSPGLVSVALQSVLFSLSLFLSLSIYLSMLLPPILFSILCGIIAFSLVADFRERDGQIERKGCKSSLHVQYIRGCVSRLGHDSLSLSLSISSSEFAFRVLPRVPGKRRTCDPSAETGRRRRSSTVSPLVLPLLPFTLYPSSAAASSHAGFFVSPRLFLL